MISVVILIITTVKFVVSEEKPDYDVSFYAKETTWYQAWEYCKNEGLELTYSNQVSCDQLKLNSSVAQKAWINDHKTYSDWIRIQGCSTVIGYSSKLNFPSCFHQCKNQSTQMFAYTKNGLCSCLPTKLGPAPLGQCLNPDVTNSRFIYTVLTDNKWYVESNCTRVVCGKYKRSADVAEQSADVAEHIQNTFCEKQNKYIDTYEKYLCQNKEMHGLFRLEQQHGQTDNVAASTLCGYITCNSTSNVTVQYKDCNATNNGFLCRNGSNDNRETTSYENPSSPPTTDSRTIILSSQKTEHYGSFTFDSTSGELSSQTPSSPERERSDDLSSSNSQQIQTTPLQNTRTESNIYSSEQQPTTSSAHIRPPRPTTQSAYSVHEHTSMYLTNKQASSSLFTIAYTKQQTITTEDLPDNDRRDDIKGPVIGGVLGFLFIATIICFIICRYRRIGPFTKPTAMKDNTEMDVVDFTATNISHYHDTIIISDNVQNGKENATYGTTANGIVNDAEVKTVGNEINGTSPNNVYAVVVKKQTSQPQKSHNTKTGSQEDDTEGTYDRLNKPLIRGEESMENNVYDSCLGNRDENDPTYNTTFDVRGDSLDNDITYDHTFNVRM